MHDNNIYYYKNVNKEQVKMWHIFQLYLADNKKPGKIPGFYNMIMNFVFVIRLDWYCPDLPHRSLNRISVLRNFCFRIRSTTRCFEKRCLSAELPLLYCHVRKSDNSAEDCRSYSSRSEKKYCSYCNRAYYMPDCVPPYLPLRLP